ncbi:MAG: 4-(cytidine 5'-diphospho)-2-C-methyl-D-erythritol kinase [Candidatus Hydrogenedentes bacterium]|nr:4-(cytidine 5'-diphospho)-2-C-methyl-D-erythritol kinase [Candidatus Hydrogenedentota bacterium]
MMHVRSHAKINLYLDVLRKRRDGYHHIETIFQTVSLADKLDFEPRASGLSMECTNPGLQAGDDNLVMRAARALQAATGCALGAHIYLDKRIPLAAGLAGGSGNAAATLWALNQLWETRLPAARLHRIAATLGADVPYCLVGGTVAATGRGEIMSALPALPKTWIILLHPELAVSTKAVYTSPHLEKSSERPFAGRTPSFRKAIRAIREGDFAAGIFNRMETAVFRMHPELAELKAALLHAGCKAAAMSGSGPTVFGVCDSEAQARQVAGALPGIRTTTVFTTSLALDH